MSGQPEGHEWIERYHDGELRGLARLRARRRLARDPEARRELERLQAVGSWLRAVDEQAPTPDLWPGIREALVGTAVAAPTVGRTSRPWQGLRFDLRWVGAGLAAAAAVFVAWLAIGPSSSHAPQRGAIRWLDPRGHPMMVLQDDGEATIIWVPETVEEGVSGEGGRVVV
jgi:anti-sigma factor RsiW